MDYQSRIGRIAGNESAIMSTKISAEQIDAILPQTQCGLCTYKGCMPYAEALANNEAEINLCPPGGVDGLLAIAKLLNKNPDPFIAEMAQKAKPPSVVVIREDECIGCTKCIQACPVDAILGSAKQMHTVISAECTGCELCITPCPVDCIDIVSIPRQNVSKADYYRNRFQGRETRLHQKNQTNRPTFDKTLLKNEKKAYIEAALMRAQNKSK